ncbi:Dynein regulatory complex protein 1, partial [Calypte anna]
REGLGEDVEPEVEEVEEEELRKSHQQVEESRQKLARLLYEGTQMVTSIQVAADCREMKRRAEEAKLKLQRVEKLEKEAKSGVCKSEEITSKWALAKEMRISEELWELLKQQQQRCAELLEEKNKLIRDLQQELKTKDEQYVETMKNQSDAIHLLLERMEEQNRHVMKSYQQQLLKIEETFELERRELLDNNKKRWEEAVKDYNAKEMEYLETRMRKVEEYEKQLEQLWLQDEEEYNVVKLQMEKEVQTLEKQLQHMKAVYQLTQEKLEYNLEVLKKQDEENTIIRSQQKRKINRLHSLLSNLKTRLRNQKKQCREETQSLAADCERIQEQCKEVQRKMRHFALSDAKKFREVWLMNEEEAKRLMGKALTADHIIHTQQLGLPWVQPHYWFLTNVGPLGHDKAKWMVTKLAVESLAERSSGGEEEEGREEEKGAASSGEGGKEKAELVEDGAKTQQDFSRTIKRILELVEAESTLEIDDEDDQYELVDFFLKYKAQEVALGQVGPAGDSDGENPAGIWARGSRTRQGREGIWGMGQPQLPWATWATRGSAPSPQGIHPDPPSVLPRTRQGWGLLSGMGGGELCSLSPRSLRLKDGAGKEMLQVRDSSKDGEYWESLAQVIPEATLKLWDALAVALEEYYKVLTCRANLLAEVATLDQQNTELCLLLEEYLNSGVNSSLICPPMQWMDLDLSCP